MLISRMRGFARTASTLAAAVLLLGCLGQSSTAPQLPANAKRVLFIGNSLTYTNDLPGMLKQLARMAGDTTLEVASVAYPDFALEDHWNQGTAPTWLRDRKWEYVVMQQGSSALPASQQHLRTWAVQFAPLVRAAGAEPVMLMVWPQQNRLFDFPNVRQSYQLAAEAIDGMFVPAGDAWVRYGNYGELYSDGLHPTRRATYLTALVLLQRLLDINPESLPPVIPGETVNQGVVLTLQAAARGANSAFPRFPARAQREALRQ